jgi:hypothetical protein
MNKMRLVNPESKDEITSNNFYSIMDLLERGYKIAPVNRKDVVPTVRSKADVRKERAERMYAYYLEDHTLQEVADRWEVSRQRVHQLFKTYGFEIRQVGSSLNKHSE